MKNVLNYGKDKKMTKSEMMEIYKKYEKMNKPFQVMVFVNNGSKGKFWTKRTVIGMSMDGYPIFSGAYVNDCLKEHKILSLSAYEELKDDT